VKLGEFLMADIFIKLLYYLSWCNYTATTKVDRYYRVAEAKLLEEIFAVVVFFQKFGQIIAASPIKLNRI
jgi:hypothetical protein